MFCENITVALKIQSQRNIYVIHRTVRRVVGAPHVRVQYARTRSGVNDKIQCASVRFYCCGPTTIAAFIFDVRFVCIFAGIIENRVLIYYVILYFDIII